MLRYYVNGSFVEESDAKVSILDRSFLYGDACFESMCIWSGRVIHLEEHMRRLLRSTRIMRIAVPDFDELCDIVLEAAAVNGMADQDGQVRIQVTRGEGQGIFNTAGLTTNIFVIPELQDLSNPASLVVQPDSLVPRRAVISTYVRSGSTVLDPRIKTTSYASSMLAYLEAADQGASIGILRDDRGFIAEGQTMNIFCVDGDKIRVPFEASALAGITRAHIMATAKNLGYSCFESNLTAYDLTCADEVFATATSIGVMPISAIGGIEFDTPAPGPVTQALNEAYAKEAIASSPAISKRPTAASLAE